MPDDVTVALANFFHEAWERYIDEPTEDIEKLMMISLLVDEYEITEEDVANETYEGDEGDVVYVLSDLGKAALKLASSVED